MPYSEIETASRRELRSLQNERLRETVERVYENDTFYRERFDDHGLLPEDIETVDDISKFPFTTKDDFAAQYPDGLLAVDSTELERIQASSGTSGNPKIAGYTSNDVETWAKIQARSLYAAGVRPDHHFHQALPYGLFTGGFGKHFGLRELGATEVPIGPSGSEQQLDFLQRFGSESGVLIPSFALYLAEEARKRGMDPREFPISNIVIGAEMTTESMRDEVEAAWDADATNNYGLTELMGPGVAAECQTGKDGLHVWEDHFYPEIIDPQSGEVLPPGEEGELVLTSLTKEAVPVIRYRTGDITTLYDPDETCACGRTHQRMAYVTGRADDLLTVRGANVYPTEIEHVLLDTDGFAPQYRIDLWTEQNLDRIGITVEHSDDFEGDSDRLRERFIEQFRTSFSFEPDDVEIVAPGSIDRSGAGKVQRVYDDR